MEYNEIIELKDEFQQTRDGEKFHHRKVYSDDRIYIYQVNGKWFEVFKRKVKPKNKMIDGKFISVEGVGRVAYPNNEDFGSWAWNCHDKGVIRTVLDKLGYNGDEINAVLAVFDDNVYANSYGVANY